MLFELAVLATPQLIVRILRCVWHGGTRPHRGLLCTRLCALESSGGGQSYLRPLPHVVAIGVVRCCGGWHGGALLFFAHCVHTPLGTWVARYGCIRSSRQRYDFSVWRGYTRAHGLPIACPAATLVVR